ncbi:TPA: ERF family protein [Enterococcus faecalis]|uniref:ERF family protein n=1 Tax=Enterococcus TaxID=1350 RepID=UPI000366AA5A|nr:ERF family protein [Enterococcus faecalis]BDH65487.1 hypothetical protein MTP05_16720 [Enterococcus sp. PLM3]EGO2747767.1 ERF family protein [Enterococcus faecalis]EGO5110280.1 ERF family protein [Enterococcus faecalis]EGO6705652.1 ERF family protein [Enterococcus faecalis]EGO6777719.1 ERF family protein [Enterococcus faecalis]
MNNCSENLEKLFDGMYKLKSKLTQPKFDAEVAYSTKKGAMKFQYATLKAIEEAIRKAAQESESGIDFQQNVVNENNALKVTTIITHISGQYIIHGPFEFPNSGTNPQGLGSLTTYARRYSLSAAFGIAADKDDDGQTAAEKNSDTPKVNLISGKQLATLNDHIRQLSELSNSELDYVRNELSKELNIDVNENMPASMFNKAIGVLKQWIQQFQPQPEENITWGQK